MTVIYVTQPPSARPAAIRFTVSPKSLPVNANRKVDTGAAGFIGSSVLGNGMRPFPPDPTTFGEHTMPTATDTENRERSADREKTAWLSELARRERLCAKECAAYIGVSVPALYNMRSEARGPVGYRIGNRLWFDRRDVDLWLARCKAATAVGA